MDRKWTLRGISDEAREMIEEVNELTGIPMGRLVSTAIEFWYDELDEVDPIPPFKLTED